MGEHFRIKHRSGGKYFRPRECGVDYKYETPIVLHEDADKYTVFMFKKIRDHWGFIQHVESKKYIHPKGGELDSGDKTPLVLHDDRHDGALFTLDVYNHRIVHLNGCFAQPENLKPNPRDGTRIFLSSKVSNASNFLFVSSTNSAEEVQVYGNPVVEGKWEILSMVRNPAAEHIEKIEIKVGKSGSESGNTETPAMKTTEISGEIKIKSIFKLALKRSTTIEKMFNNASSDTWCNETTRTRKIRVQPGKTVVTWQYVFTFMHCGTKSMFKSNILADTDSETLVPADIHDEIK